MATTYAQYGGTANTTALDSATLTPALDAVADGAGLSCLHVIRVALTNGGGGAADDVTIYNANAPFKFRVLDAYLVVTGGNSAGRTVTLRTATAGGGSAVSDALAATNTGMNRNGATTPATATIAAGGTLVARRSHDAVAGDLVVLLRPET